jgi:DNA-binding transcriptional LysR family regulator
VRAELDDLLLFAEVAQQRSVTRAAGQLGQPKSTVSRRLAALEQRVGTALIVRSTRSLRLTEAGAELLQRASRIAELWHEVRDWSAAQARAPTGTLRVSLPPDFAQHWLAAPLASFALRHPALRLELDLAPRRADVIGEGLDVAIRIGPLADSGLVARKLADIERGVFASPALLARVGAKTTDNAADAAQWPRVEMAQDRATPLVLQRGRKTLSWPPQGRCVVNSIGMLRELVLHGAGIGVLPLVMCSAEEQRGELVGVLPAWHAATLPVHALMPARAMPAKTRALLEHLLGALNEPPPARSSTPP